jgi:hypothetical protein
MTLLSRNEFVLLNRISTDLERIATALETANKEVAERYTTLSTLENTTFDYDTPATPGGREES